jgi:hypothetical protein
MPSMSLHVLCVCMCVRGARSLDNVYVSHVPFDCGVDISIIEDENRRLAAKFQRDVAHTVSACLHDL